MTYELTNPSDLATVLQSMQEPVGSPLAGFMHKFLLDRSNMSILVISDSTYDQTNVSAGQKRPMRLLGDYLAEIGPTKTVNFRHWNMTSGSMQSDGFNLGGYDALGVGKSEVIQVGTGTGNAGGPFVVDIYNMAASGTTPAYAVLPTRWSVIATPFNSAYPDCFIVNHGHNLGTGNEVTMRYELPKLIRGKNTRWPNAAGLLTAQNPTDPAREDYDANDIVRANAVAGIAAESGFGLINALGIFLQNPNWVTEYLQDGLHENQAGSDAWFNGAIKPLFKLPSPLIAPSAPVPAIDHVWKPASEFHAFSGSPTLAIVNSEGQFWALPAGASSAIQADVLLPVHWKTYDTWVYWAVAGASGYSGSTVAAFRLKRQQRAYHVNVPADVSPYPIPVASDTGIVTKNPNNGTAYQTVQSQLSQQSAVLKAPVGMQIWRSGESASDTLTSDVVYVKGVLFVKAS